MITYETIQEEDYETLTYIMKAAFDDDTRMHTDLQEDGPAGYDDGSLIRTLNTKEGYISRKVCVDGETVGMYTVYKDGTEYTLDMLIVNPAWKSKGIGSEIWRHLEQTYTEAKKWYVETPEYSKRNHYFYVEKCGFTFLRENQYEDGEKSFVFVKKMKNDVTS